jgi:MFS family permease
MKEIRFEHLVALVAILSALRFSLVLADVLPPLSSNSPGHSLFVLANIAVMVYLGWTFSKGGLKSAAIKGAVAAFASSVILVFAMAIGTVVQKPVLGIAIPSFEMLLLVLLFTSMLNIAIGAILAVCGAWLARLLQKKGIKKKGKK